MSYSEIAYSVADNVATITLNRPDKLNAWTATMEGEVRDAALKASADQDARVIVLTGAGRGFCAGADMGRLQNFAASGTADSAPPEPHGLPGEGDNFNQRYAYFPALRKPVIAAINGPCAGLGLIMALYCDIRIAAEGARFTTAFARRGLIAEHGISWLLPRITGLPAALDLMLSGRTFDAAEALRLGLVSQVWPLEDFRSRTLSFARELATLSSPRSTAVMKRQLWDAMFQDLAQATAAAHREMLLSFDTEDFREGVAHFVEKRAPQFTGR
jgi:enoyl-CoA hydratase/carnithine racemase